MAETRDTQYTHWPICPHCGHEFTYADEWEGEYEEFHDCDCGAQFSWHRVVKITYCTELQTDPVSPGYIDNAHEAI